PPKLSAFPTTLSLSLPPTPMVKISVDIRFRSSTPEIRQESGTGGSRTTVSREPGPGVVFAYHYVFDLSYCNSMV
ncbi:unnamed protein product, partial [Musa hybrid cultivar]